MSSYDMIKMADIKIGNIPRKMAKARPAIEKLLKEREGMALSITYIRDYTRFCYSTVHGILKELIYEQKVERELVRGRKKHFFTWIEE